MAGEEAMGGIGEMDWRHPGDSLEVVPDRGAVYRTGRSGWRTCGGVPGLGSPGSSPLCSLHCVLVASCLVEMDRGTKKLSLFSALGAPRRRISRSHIGCFWGGCPSAETGQEYKDDPQNLGLGGAGGSIIDS